MKLLILFLALFYLTGCHHDVPIAPNAPSVEETQMPVPNDLYLYTDDTRYLAIDNEGNPVLEVTDGQMGILRTEGLATGIAVQRAEGVVTDEYGWNAPEKTWCDIYSVTGEYEYSVPLNYVNQEGPFLSGYDLQAQTSKIYRRSDGALLYDDIYTCYAVGDYFYVNQGAWDAPGFFLDSRGEAVCSVPEEYSTAGCDLDNYLTVVQNGLVGLMRPDGTMALPCIYEELRAGQLGCVFVKNETGWHAVEVETGNVLFSSPTLIQYLLPHAAIVAVDHEKNSYQLVGLDGTPKTEQTFSWPSAHDTNADGIPEMFSATTDDYSKAFLFAPDGTVLYHADTNSSITVLSQTDALLSRYMEKENRNIWSWLDLQAGTETPLSAAYENIYYNPLYSEYGIEPGLISRGGTNELGWYRTDILDADGNVLLEDLQDMIYRGNGIFQCSRGFSSGLLKLDGTWLYEESSFSTLTDD